MLPTATVRGFNLRLTAGAALALAAALVSGSVVAASGIAATKHNLSAVVAGSVSANKFTATAPADDELCVFCHTPHGAATAGTSRPPLWNRILPTGQPTYATYASTTMDAAGATDGPGNGMIGSVSIACLSCHDGAQAMNNVINKPGSGGWDPTTGSAIPGAWTAPSTGTMGTGITNLNDVIGAGPGTAGLANDHPIGIAYCAWTAASTADGSVTCGDSDFQNGATSKLKWASGKGWWLDTDSNTTRNKQDLILYTRTFTAGSGPSVECATCHDPHLETYSGGAAARTFLRVANTGSAVCLSCHVK